VEAARFFETLVSYCNTTQYHDPKDLNLNVLHCENLKSYIKLIVRRECALIWYTYLLFSLLILFTGALCVAIPTLCHCEQAMRKEANVTRENITEAKRHCLGHP
jgi:hypothetical protein